MDGGKFEPVIGLEVHVQLSTKSKIFCGCSTEFGLSPNSSTCPVCLGLPGTLPVLNKDVFHAALKVALALNCNIQSFVKFDRKNYYYPDLPKNFQISQYDKPIAFDGSVELMDTPGRKIKVRRVHLEEDAGKLLHDQDKVSSVVDYNRTGTPLLEIVTEPDIFSPDEAYEYLTTLKDILLYLGISDCNMEEGSLRCDANISVRPRGEKTLGVKSELKNMNSFKAVRAALAYEITRHIELLDSGNKVLQETRLWDPDREVSASMRTKEETHDYRYFPEPDLVPFHIAETDVDNARSSMPELPKAKRARFVEQYGLSIKEAGALVADREIAEYFEKAALIAKSPKAVYNWVTQDIMAGLNSENLTISGYGFTPEMLAELISLIDEGVISGKMAKQILVESREENLSPKKLVEQKGLKQITDGDEITRVCDSVIAANQKSVNDYKNGKSNALGFLVGQVMRETKGKANPALVNKLLKEKLG